MLDQLVHLGYDKPWREQHPNERQWAVTRVCPAATEPIVLYPEMGGVRIPAGTGFDPGGIGKGFAADLVTDFLNDRGATCTSVELGGDVRVSGEPWFGASWRIGVANPFDPSTDIGAFAPQCGAVATSSTLRRRWTNAAEQRHHLLDPRTGLPSDTDLVSVTACSSVAWWAEVAAKTAVIAGASDAISLLNQFGTPGVAVSADGRVQTSPMGTELHSRKPEEEMAIV